MINCVKILIKSFFTYGACQNTAECRSLSSLRVILEIKKLRRGGVVMKEKMNHEALSLIASLLSEAFNREYESGEKDTYDYGKDMKKFYEQHTDRH